MNIIKTISLFFVCFTLLSANVANAVIPCCMTDTNGSSAEMQMEKADMPCHETTSKEADSNEQQEIDCSGCNCQHCIKMSALPPQASTQGEVVSSFKVYTTQNIYSRTSEGVFQPPKRIS